MRGNDWDEPKEIETFSEEWPDAVLNDMENANWHTAYECFEPLIRLLPAIYLELDSFDQERLKRVVDHWEKYF